MENRKRRLVAAIGVLAGVVLSMLYVPWRPAAAWYSVETGHRADAQMERRLNRWSWGYVPRHHAWLWRRPSYSSNSPGAIVRLEDTRPFRHETAAVTMRVDLPWLVVQVATAACVLLAVGRAVARMRFRGWTTVSRAVAVLVVGLWGLVFFDVGWRRIRALSTGFAPSLTWAVVLFFLLGLLAMGSAVTLLAKPRPAAKLAVVVLGALDAVVIQQLLVADRPVRGLSNRVAMACMLAATAAAVTKLFLRPSTPRPVEPPDGA